MSFLGDLWYFAAMSQKSVYLDYNATTPAHPSLKNKVAEWLEISGNPSSIHSHGREAKKLLRETRQAVAQALNAHPMEIVFTSGGSEGNNTAIRGLLKTPMAQTRREIIVSPVEHPSVSETMEYAREQGFSIRHLQINSQGEIDFDHFQTLLSEKTLFVSVMLANNETGHIFPLKKISELAKGVGALVHTDSVQALGRIPVNLQDLGVDIATFSGHKLYALKGIGILFCRRGIVLPTLMSGGGQERGRRAGTENTLAIASLGHMVQVLQNTDLSYIEKMRNDFEARVLREVPGIRVVGASGKRMGNTSNLIVDGIPGESLLMSLDLKGFSISTGSACSSGKSKPSPVLTAMGYSESDAQSSIRVSLGLMTTPYDMENFVEALKLAASHLRSLTPGGMIREAASNG